MLWGRFDLSMYCMYRGQWTESANHSIIIASTPFWKAYYNYDTTQFLQFFDMQFLDRQIVFFV